MLTIAVSVVLCLSLVAGGFVLVTMGREYESCGVKQNSRIYMTDVYCMNRTIYYTVVNNSCKTVKQAQNYPLFERMENGKWVSVQLVTEILLPRGPKIKPFSYYHGTMKIQDGIEETQGDLVGHYRILQYDGAVAEAERFFVVGYFDITAEALKAPTN